MPQSVGPQAQQSARSHKVDSMTTNGPHVRGFNDVGQTAIILVVMLGLVTSLIGAVLVNTMFQAMPLQRAVAVSVYAHRAIQAGENAYVAALNANPSLAQCNTSTNGAGTCAGISYGQWNEVAASATAGSDPEYYAFGNPQPSFYPTTHELKDLAVQVVGAVHETSARNHYMFTSATMHLAATNGFLTGIWWSNYESYSATGNYSSCKYNWPAYNGAGSGCTPVYFGPNDYVFGPTFTNDSIYESGSPSFGTATAQAPVQTADPNCLFVTSSFSATGCQNINSTIIAAPYVSGSNGKWPACDTTHSCYNHPVELPPANNASLGVIAAQNGCLYTGPTRITFSTLANGTGQMTVVSPETKESTKTVKGKTFTWDTANIASNTNDCPNNGSAPLPANGVVYVQNASPADSIAGANPFGASVYNTVTNVTASPTTPVVGSPVTLTATITSASGQLSTGATVSFSQGTTALSQCANVALSSPTPVTPTTNPPTYSARAVCTLTSATAATYSATFNANTTYTTTSQGQLGKTNVLTSTVTRGPNAQTSPGCNACYYGATSAPDIEGDAFVNGNLSGQVTVGTANDIIITGNITYANCDWTVGQSGLSTPSLGFCPPNIAKPNDSLGLIANAFVEVNHPIVPGTSTLLPTCTTPGAVICNPSNGTTGLTIDAAILALTKSFVVNNYAAGGPQGNLNNYGSIQQYARGPVGTFSGNSSTSGYLKHYNWSPLLDYISPPSYLTPSTSSWNLTSIDTNAGSTPTNQCPPLKPVYGSTLPITQYCTASIGGLPTYPSSTAPSAPTDVVVLANADGTAAVSWTTPGSTGNSPILNYNVGISPVCPACTGTSSTTTSTIITGLTPGTYYVFSLTATNALGTSDPSLSSSSVVIPTVPDAPTLVSAVASLDGSVSVNWTPPSARGSAITGYKITPTPGCFACTGLTSLLPTTVITGLTTGSTYTFTVTATNLLGSGAASAASNSIIIPTVPGVPTAVTASSAANRQSVVAWTAPVSNGGSAITGYTVSSTPGRFTCTTSGTSCAVTGLTNGTSYTFKVSATNVLGVGTASAASNSAVPSAVSSAPTGATATASNASATVSWTAPTTTGGAAISGYTVTSSTGNFKCTTTGATSCTVTGLSNGTAYTFSVVAGNASGNGVASAASNVVTPSGLPASPTAVAATSYLNAQSVISWTAPGTNGSPITGYTVTSSGGQTCTAIATARSCTVTGLTNGTTYTFTVTATNAIGISLASAGATATPATVPGAPTALGTSVTATSITVSWTAPVANGGSAITGYTAVASPSGLTCTSAATTCTITGLTAGTLYTVKVTTTNGAGTGSAGSTTATTSPPAGAPGAPTGAAATSNANASSVVSWLAPASNGGSAITGYTVTSSPGGFTCTSATTTCTVAGLTNGTAYTFTVTATNANGTGLASVASPTATPSTVPGAPTAATATSNANASSAVSWTAPASNGGSAITTYKVTSSPGNFQCTSATSPCTVNGLTNGTAYTFTVTATNANGTGAASAASAAATPATVPGTPTGVGATSGTAGSQLTVTWTPPTSNGGSAITGYTVQRSQSPYTTWTTTTCTGTATSCIVTGLANGTTYAFHVLATNARGNGAYSTTSAAVAPANPGNTVPGTPSGVVGTSNQNTLVPVSWVAPTSNGGSAITGYTVTSSPGGLICSAATTFCTVTGLTNGTAYTFTVRATNVRGNGTASAASAAATPSTVPGAPTTVTGTSNTNGSSAVSWTAPASNGGATISAYTVISSPGGFQCTSATSPCTVTGLTNGTAYTFTVTATNASGTGAASAASAAATPAGPPSAPSGVAGTSYANTSSVVSWAAPASNGGAAITGYTVTSSPGSFICTTTGATFCTVGGLTNGTAYTFTVKATNGSGTGAASGASASATPATVPGAPTTVTATSNANTQSVVSWTTPAATGGVAITGYAVTAYIGGAPQATQTFNTTAVSDTFTGLINGTAYTFTVAAINGSGTGASSAASGSATPAAAPPAPTGVTATAATASATITWTAPASNNGAAVSGYVVTSSPLVVVAPACSTSLTGSSTSCVFTGLTNGTAYTFTLAAINAAGTGSPSTASNSVTPATVPGAPTAVSGTSYANSTSVVTWTAPASTGGASITGYTVTATDSTTPANGGQACVSATSPCTMTGLTNGDSYTFTVTATNSAGTGASSTPSAAAVPATVPGSPTVTGVTAGNASVIVTWTAPASNGGAAITGYTATASGNQTCTTSGALTCTISGLTNGNNYAVTVTATNPSGTGLPSASSPAFTPIAPSGAPTGVSATSNANAKSVVTWTAPVSNGGSTITGYTVTSSPGGFTCTASGARATSCTVTGLTNGTAYTFTVTATNGAGTSAPSLPSASATPAAVPGAPTGVTATSNQNSVSTVSWTAPISNGGSAITGYVVSALIGGTIQVSQTFNTTSTSGLIVGLVNGTSYVFQVSAINVLGTGLASTLSAPATPGATPDAPISVLATSNQNQQSTISWTAPFDGGSPISRYTVTSSPGTFQCTTTGATSCIVTGLTNGTPYTFTVTATNSIGPGSASAPSNAATPSTVPGAPTGITIASVGASRVTLTWTAPVSDGGAAITGYTVTSSQGQTCTASTTSCTVTGLVNGNAYTFTVTATNPSGTGLASTPSAPATPSTVPDAPTTVTATSGATSSSVVSWTAPVFNGGSSITGYTVTSSPGGLTCTTTSATFCTVSGLTNGTAYTFTVTATNAAGPSLASAPSASATPSTVPGAPTTVTATSRANASSVVAWTAPVSNGGSTITGYTVTSSPGAFTCTSATTSCTVTGLTNGTGYTFTVTATNASGTGVASAPSATATPSTLPNAPTAVTATSNANASSVVSWTAPASNGGSAISLYTVTSSPGAFTCTSATTSCTVTGLTNGTGYTFTVKATNAVGTGAASVASSSAIPATVPGAPTIGVASGSGGGTASVTWTAPVSNGGSGITGYTVTSSPGGITASCGSSPCTVTGLSRGTYTFTVTATNNIGTGSASASSNVVTLSSGAATKLAVTTQPAGAVNGTGFTTQPVVTVQDASGNTVTTSSAAVTLAVATGTGTLACTTNPQAASSGIATFAGCALNGMAGHFTLTASAAGLTSATTSSFALTAGAAAKLAVTTQPAGAANGAAFTTQPVVTVQGSGGNTVPGSTASVTLAVASGTGTLACTTNPQTATAGIATFAGCALTGIAGNFTLTASATGVTSATTSSFALTAGAATKLAVTTQPAGAANAAAFTTQPVVTVQDSGGNTVSGSTASITLAVASGSGVLSCTTNPVTAASGIATFAGCKLTGTAGNYTLTATGTGLSSATTPSFSLTAGAASKLAVTTQPGGAVSGAAFTTQPVVTVQDASGNTVTGSSASVTLAVASGTGVLSCTTNPLTASAGIATFAGCKLTGTAGNFTLTASAAGLTSATTTIFALTAGAATKLAVTTQPAGAVNGVAFTTQPVVTVQDASGNTVTGSSAPVTLAVASGTGTLACTTNPLTATAGIATFAGCALTGTAGNFILTATSTGLTGATTSSFALTAGSAAKLAVTTQPAGAVNGTAFTTQPAVTVQDSGGNTVSGSTASITLAVATGTGVLACTTNPVTAVSGIATFAGCKLTGTAGNYTLSAAATGLTGATSASFALTAGAANKLAVTTQPAGAVNGAAFTTQPVVTIQDASGNTVTGSSAPVTLAVATGTGTLACATNPQTATGGIATFAGCKLTGTLGNFTLTTSSAGLTSATTASFALTVGAAAQLAITTQPSATATNGVAFASQPVVTVQDIGGNTVTGSSASVTLAVASGAGVVACTTNPQTAVSGITTFAGCKLTGTVGSYTLTASSTGLTGATTSSIALSVGAAAQLAFTTQPSASATNGVAFTTQPVVTVQDSGGNAVTTGTNSTATITLTPSAGALTCTAASKAAVAGVATFAGCTVTGIIGSYTLGAAGGVPALTGATSTSINVTAGAATKLIVTTQPSGAVSGAAFTTQPIVTVQDTSGNTATGSSAAVTLAVASGTGTLACTTNPQTATSGIATFAGCKLTGTVGNFTLTASSTGLTSATTSSFALTAGVASKLAVTTQPSTTVANAVALASQPVLTVQDASGNTVTTSSAPIILSVVSGSGALACTTNTVNASSGVATFAGCALTGTAGNYTLTATSAGLTSATTNPVALTIGAASKLAFTTQPIASNTPNANFTTQPVVTVQDSGGNKVTASTASITLTASSGTFSCTTNPLSAVAGVATFAGCKDSLSNATFFTTNYLTATSSGLTPATTTTTGANQLVITTQPVAAINGTAFATQPVVAIADARGNVITSATNAVTLAAVPGGASLACTTNPVSAVAGIATFAGCTFTGAVGPSSFTATATGLTTDTSTSITVVAGVAGAVNKLAFTTSALSATAGVTANMGPITVQEQDANGNPTITAETVTLSSNSTGTKFFSATSGGTSGGSITTVSIPSGSSSATFYYSDAKSGSPVITASATGLTSATQTETITAPVPPAGTSVVAAPSPKDGIANASDKFTFTYNTVMSPGSMLSGWTGSSASVYVNFTRISGSPTQMAICTVKSSCTGTTLYNLGSVDLGDTSRYVASGSSTYTTATLSMATVGSVSVVTLTLTATATGWATQTGSFPLTWTPSALATDTIGTASATTAVTTIAAQNF